MFDDGDEKTLRRTSLCLKGERHFAESEVSGRGLLFPFLRPFCCLQSCDPAVSSCHWPDAGPAATDQPGTLRHAGHREEVQPRRAPLLTGYVSQPLFSQHPTAELGKTSFSLLLSVCQCGRGERVFIQRGGRGGPQKAERPAAGENLQCGGPAGVQ